MNLILCIIICLLSLVYSIYYLIRGKNIKIECKSNNRIVIIVVYLIFIILILIKEFSKVTIITSCILLISSIIYSIIPSGYDDKGIYISGRFFSFNKIDELNVDYVNDYYQLSFSYNGKYHILISDDKARLNECKLIYENIVKK